MLGRVDFGSLDESLRSGVVVLGRQRFFAGVESIVQGLILLDYGSVFFALLLYEVPLLFGQTALLVFGQASAFSGFSELGLLIGRLFQIEIDLRWIAQLSLNAI